ncbi:SMP-30/gluconolactonase/LRE family protein [Sphingobacterium cellulitidis]|uniref:SMP-30/gluconolactonase/LRE family protein n=1 Tax=Sphingobacterium cellulitidis TaxID=1768011 RepID=UPI000B93F767|nr:hypothetical protein CHT99_09305 [Sphingobacterium cellulitidis]
MLESKRIEMLDFPICQHGEGPVWHSERQSAFWVDILSDQIIEYSWVNKTISQYAAPKMVSAIFEIEDDLSNLIITYQGGVGIYDLQTQQVELLDDLGIEWLETRCNDAAIDPDGNLWFSTTHIDHQEAAGALYRYDSYGKLDKVLSDVSISNGPCWSPDGKFLFHTDSGYRRINSYEFQGTHLEALPFQIEVSEGIGFPDGMCMDGYGVLWVAIWSGFRVVGIDTNKRTDKMSSYQEAIGNSSWLVQDVLDLPIPQVSSCCLVGPDLDHLLVTSSRKDLSQEDLEKYPDSGKVFIIKMNSKGLALSPYKKKFKL